jgi:RNA polymerase sigma-70 factor (ECF subfamily)
VGLDSIIPLSGAIQPLTIDQLRRSSDEQIMAAIQNDHADALAVLYDRYNRLVFSIALKITRDPGEAEDVVQNVFLEIFRSATQFDAGRGTAKVWVLQYAYHRSINRREHLQLRGFYDAIELSDVIGQTAPWPMQASVSDSRRLVRQGLSGLNEAQRRVIELACMEGLTMREIAQQTGESLANVRNHYYRGLEKLRCILGPAASVKKSVLPVGGDQ